MGRKSKRSKNNINQVGVKPSDIVIKKEMSKSQRREVVHCIDALLQKCTQQYASGSAAEWEEFVQIYRITQRVISLQRGYSLKHQGRDEHMPQFMEWIQKQGVDTSSVAIEKYHNTGFGLKALRNIALDETFLAIPRKAMLTTESARNSPLGQLINDDKVLSNMPNIVLALHLLSEACNPDSEWMPYIRILPSSYTTPLYFTLEEIEMLRGSPTRLSIISMYRNIVRQYAYFYRIFNVQAELVGLPHRDFCFEDYRWAVSTVMTRQNQIPPRNGAEPVLALIPLWDMCNHTEGHVTTDFNFDKDRCECHALSVYEKEAQIFIFYGNRTNAELLLHSGFVYIGNKHDKLNIKMGISKNDSLFGLKCRLLSVMNLLPVRHFDLHAGTEPVDSELLAYLRVFCMSHEELNTYLENIKVKEFVQSLKDFTGRVSLENERKCWKFVLARMDLLLSTYELDIDHDVAMLSQNGMTPSSRLVLQQRLGEKRILATTKAYASQKLKSLDGDASLQSKSIVENEDDNLDEEIANISIL